MGMTEAEIRASLVDKRLLASGWDVSDHAKVVEEYTVNGSSSVKDDWILSLLPEHSSYETKTTQQSR